MRRTALCIITLTMITASIGGIAFGFEKEEGIPPTRSIQGRNAISTGLPQSASFSTVEVGDHDGDGRDEIYLGGAGRSNPKTQGIQAYEYNTTSGSWGSFGSGLPGGSSGKYFGALGMGDVNGDGNLDIVAPVPTRWYSVSTEAVYIYTSNSNAQFSLAYTFDVDKSTNEAEVADLDGDGSQDIVFSYYGGIEAHFGSGSSTSWTESSPSAAGNEIDGIGVGDLNNDGLLDIVGTPYFGSKAIRMYIQGSSRSWSEVTFRDTSNEAFGIKIADMDGDSNNDVVYGSRGEGIKVFTGNGGGSSGGTSFSWTDNSSGLPTSGGDWQQVEVADIDGDDDLDIIASSSGGSRARLFINDLPNSWTELFSGASNQLTVGGNAYGANFGDWDGDGYLDCAGCSWGGGADAWLVTRTIIPPPVNQRPTPNAGDDIEIMLGETAHLDGTNSSDPEDAPSGDDGGDVLHYDWNVTTYPPGSSIRDGSLTPSDNSAEVQFDPDKVGAYTISLAVRDSDDAWSNMTDEDQVTIVVIKPNDPPTADAGQDLSVHVDEEVVLDGTESFDPDGSIVEWEWTCTSHTVSFTDGDTSTPSFTPDTAGIYEISLRVRDDNDTWSGPDTVNATVIELGENLPPVANAGQNQEVLVGDEVTLDGSDSQDQDGDIITWEWICTSHPGLTFSNLNSSSPSFTPDTAGQYVITLRVRDNNGTWSGTDSVTVTVEEPYVNTLPTADAGEDMEAFVGDMVRLDGRNSTDPNGLVIDYLWTCTSHDIVLSGSGSARPYFIPEEAATYVFTLSVMDNEDAWSPEDIVNVIVTERPGPITVDIELGPFLFEDDTPLIDASVEITMGVNTYQGMTDDTGYAPFTDISPGEYSCSVVFGQETVINEVSVTVLEDGSYRTQDGGSFPKVSLPSADDDDTQSVDDDDEEPANGEKEEDDGSISIAVLLIVILVIVVLIAVGAAVFFLYIRPNYLNEEGSDGTDAENICPRCGGPMEYQEDFDRYKCSECGRYS